MAKVMNGAVTMADPVSKVLFEQFVMVSGVALCASSRGGGGWEPIVWTAVVVHMSEYVCMGGCA